MSVATPRAAPRRCAAPDPGLGEVCRARHVVATLGGRFSLELGIDVDLDVGEIDRWALGATLIGDASPGIGIRTYRVLESAGIRTLEDVRGCHRPKLERLLSEGGYGPHATGEGPRLLALADDLRDRNAGRVATLGEEIPSSGELEGALRELLGWDELAVGIFLRELRGVWPGAEVALDPRVGAAARHVALPAQLRGLSAVAAAAHLDLRDLEVGLVRLAWGHDLTRCPGGAECPHAALDREQLVHF